MRLVGRGDAGEIIRTRPKLPSALVRRATLPGLKEVWAEQLEPSTPLLFGRPVAICDKARTKPIRMKLLKRESLVIIESEGEPILKINISDL